MSGYVLPFEEVDACIKYWQGKLNLLHWRVTWVVVESSKIPSALMEITPKRERGSAIIFIKQSTLDAHPHCDQEFQGFIVHELTHLIFDPIAEEHSLQTEYCVQDARHRENVKRFRRALERAVEHTAIQIVALTPLFDPTQQQLVSLNNIDQAKILKDARAARLVSAARRRIN